MLLFSLYAGLQMWQVRPGAVVVAKRFLLANLIYGLVVPAVVAVMIGLPELAGDAVKTALRAITYTAIWYPYLLKSKRVRATYS